MTKLDIIALIQDNHKQLLDYLETRDDNQWNGGPEGKWTIAQVVLHLLQSTKALNKGLSIPKIILRYKFGKCNRPLRSYDEVVNRYHEKLANTKPGATSPFSKNMAIISGTTKEELVDKLTREVNHTCKHIEKWKDNKLNKLILPHPLMGKMPIREMLMWTGHHTKHHLDILKSKY